MLWLRTALDCLCSWPPTAHPGHTHEPQVHAWRRPVSTVPYTILSAKGWLMSSVLEIDFGPPTTRSKNLKVKILTWRLATNYLGPQLFGPPRMPLVLPKCLWSSYHGSRDSRFQGLGVDSWSGWSVHLQEAGSSWWSKSFAIAINVVLNSALCKRLAHLDDPDQLQKQLFSTLLDASGWLNNLIQISCKGICYSWLSTLKGAARIYCCSGPPLCKRRHTMKKATNDRLLWTALCARGLFN